MQIKSIMYISSLVIIELLSVSSLKYWSETNKYIFLYLGLLGYLLVGTLFAYILNIHSDMSIINSLWQVLNIILVSIIGIMIYKEKLSVVQYIGLSLAIISVILLSVD